MSEASDKRRWTNTIEAHLADLARQFDALENAMQAFGADFELAEFKRAYDTTENMDLYNRAQALERAVGRVQNFATELAQAGVKLAALELPPIGPEGSKAAQAFQALRDSGVIGGQLARRLIRAQKLRSRLEHSYVTIPAGDVHRTAILVRDSSLQFIGPYRRWIEPHLRDEEVPA